MKKECQVQKKTNKKQILNSSFVLCPVCKKQDFNVIQSLDEIPYFGEVLETFAQCGSCKYKTYDILPLAEKKFPKQQKIKISEKNLCARVVKGKYCEIQIPEIGLTVEPGPDSEAYISNVEGVLDRMIFALKSMKSVKPESKKEIDEKIEMLQQAKQGKKAITLVFKDEQGQSAIIKEKVK